MDHQKKRQVVRMEVSSGRVRVDERIQRGHFIRRKKTRGDIWARACTQGKSRGSKTTNMIESRRAKPGNNWRQAEGSPTSHSPAWTFKVRSQHLGPTPRVNATTLERPGKGPWRSRISSILLINQRTLTLPVCLKAGEGFDQPRLLPPCKRKKGGKPSDKTRKGKPWSPPRGGMPVAGNRALQ